MAQSAIRYVPQQIDRTRARAWALHVHYRWEVEDRVGSLADALYATATNRRIAPARLPYIERLLVGLDEHGEGVDARLDEALDNWRMDRLSILDRGVLRIAAVEILHFQDVPPKVSIQEAVRLAERYSGNDSPRFVNGVLDALFKRSAD
jgi:N utilization substance protein B